jgi:RNA polymerase sigma-70 factor (ECF subfamily)
MDRQAFEEEALAWADTVYRVARWMMDDPHAAEDLVQETYLRAFKGYRTYQPGTDCRSWLLRILRNAATDVRRRKKLPTVDIDDADPRELVSRAGPAPGKEADAWGDPEAWQALLAGSTDDQILAAVQGLAEPLRQAFCLVVLGECSYKEAADLLGCAEGTIKSRMSRACGQLRGVLTPRKPAGRPRPARVGSE